MLLAGLALSPLMPEVAAALYFAACAVGLVLAFPFGGLVWTAPMWLPLVAGALLVTANTLATRPFDHLIGLVFFAPMLLVFAATSLLRRSRELLSTTAVTLLSAFGAASALAYALATRVLSDDGVISVNNSIHFASVALLLGFGALAGLHSARMRIRLLALVAPLCGLLTVALSDTRGPLLAAAAMIATALVIAIGQYRGRRAGLITFSVLAVLALITPVMIVQLGYEAHVPGLDILIAQWRGDAIDGSSEQRLLIYGSGLRAFADAPLFGHGMLDLIGTASRYAPEPEYFPVYDHLHNDILDFAVASGALGLLAYAAFLATPLSTLATPPSRERDAATLALVPVVIGYLVLGLTNAVIGIIAQTVVLAALSAIWGVLTERR